MKAIENDLMWDQAWLDTPRSTPPSSPTPQAAMRIPGCYIVSQEQKASWPMLYGRLSRYDTDADRVVVRSSNVHHLNDNPKTVWIGTTAQYEAMWRCD